MVRSTELPLEMETVKASYSGTFSAKGLIDWWLSMSLGKENLLVHVRLAMC